MSRRNNHKEIKQFDKLKLEGFVLKEEKERQEIVAEMPLDL